MSADLEDSAEIKATGKTRDGIVTVRGELGKASIEFTWDADEADDIDLLISAAPQIAENVIAQLIAAQDAAEAEASE